MQNFRQNPYVRVIFGWHIFYESLQHELDATCEIDEIERRLCIMQICKT